jgi:hypothetical protein
MAEVRKGRKPVQIDLTELEKLCTLQCTDEEIANWFGVSTRTIENRRKRPEFAQTMQKGRSRGRISVRRTQMKILEAGNASMGIWLGKQLLGQRDSIVNEHIGAGGGPIQLTVKPDLSRLSDEELEQLQQLVSKTLPEEGN